MLLVLLVACCLPGCVRRRMTIHSNPPGALVYVDDQEIGITPVSTSFTYYGTRKIQLIKDGYETVNEMHTFDPPWYQYPPIDFFSENLWPYEVRDERILNFDLTPQQIVPTEQLLQRAGQLRANATSGYATPSLPPLPSPETVQPRVERPVVPNPQPLPSRTPTPDVRLSPPQE